MHRTLRIGSRVLGGLVALLMGATVVWAQCWSLQAKKSGYPNARLLIDTQEVAAHLEDVTIRLLDLRAKGAEGYEEYKKGHIPGAVYLNWEEIDDVTSNRKGIPIDQVKAEALFGKLGIDDKTRVVAYDDSGGLWSARLSLSLNSSGTRTSRS